MTPELVHIYQELAKIGAYFIQHSNDPKLHLIVIQKPTISNIYEFAVREVQRQLLLHLFGSEDVPSLLSQTELHFRQLPIIRYQGKKSARYLSEV